LRHLFVLLPLFRALTADPRTPYAPQKLPRPCGVPPQPQKGTGARGIPRPTRTASNPVTSLPPVNVTIHTRTDLNNCQKFHYFKSCLKGDAFSTVQALSISSGNYQVAWELLEKRYNNLRLIVQEHVNSLLSIHKISKASNTALRQLINDVNTNIEALKILKQPTDKWDALLVPIIIEKLDYGTNRE
jgi:hypothetical protein